jgi:hypothetical protein
LPPAPFAPKLPGVRIAAALLALPLLLAAPPLPAQTAADIEQIGPWRMICYRGDKMYGHAFESCRAYASFNAVGVYLDRTSKGLIGYLGGKHCTETATVFRASAGSLAPGKKNRAVNLIETIDKAFKSCGKPPSGADAATMALVLQRSDGLSPDWAAE